MKVFINNKKKNKYKEKLNKFSNENKFISSGVAKSFSDKKYSWLADFLFKSRNNTDTNKHKAFISFFSNKEIAISEFGHIALVQYRFPFLKDYKRERMSLFTYELSSRQYRLVGQEHTEFDLIEYINASDKIFADNDNGSGINLIINEGDDDENTVFVNHEYNDSPVFHCEGYKLYNKLKEIGSNSYPRNVYIWANPANSCDINLNNFQINLNDSNTDLLSSDIVRETMEDDTPLYDDFFFPLGTNTNYGTISGSPTLTPSDVLHKYVKMSSPGFEPEYFYIIGAEYFSLYTNEIVLTLHKNVFFSTPIAIEIYDIKAERVVDYKIQINHNNFYYFKSSDEWVVYHSYYNLDKLKDYYSTNGFVICYDENDSEIYPDDILYLPAVMEKNKFEPGKIIVKWVAEQSGKCCFNPGHSSSANKDQSKLTYRISNKMFNVVDGKYVVDYTYYNDFSYDKGVSFEKERNRRASNITTTDPYMITTPISNGKLVNYKFVDENDNDINSDNLWGTSKSVYLKIKADLNIINKIKREIDSNNINTDIINTIHVKPSSTIYNSSSSGYDKFYGSSMSDFYERQDYYITDENISPTIFNTYYNYEYTGDNYSNFNSFNSSDYTDDKLKFESMGCYIDESGDPINTIYCHDIHKDENGSSVLKSSTFLNSTEDLFDHTIKVESNEILKPMLKLPGIQGYVKIIREHGSSSIHRTSDNLYEMKYIVEFPYAPGSYQARNESDNEIFIDGYNETQILKSFSYINAGYSIETPNERKRFKLNEIFSFFEVSEKNKDIITSRKGRGGGTVLPSYNKDKINYPYNFSYNKLVPNSLNFFSHLEFDFLDVPYINKDYIDNIDLEFISNVNNDIELSILVNNEKWRFDKDKYESYIGRENPSYVFEVDINTLYNDYNNYQKNNACLPDLKRWLYFYIKGFAYTKNEIVNDISCNKSFSDTILEIWDNKSVIKKLKKHISSTNVSIDPSSDDVIEFSSGSLYIGSVQIGDYVEIDLGIAATYRKTVKDIDYDESTGEVSSITLNESSETYGSRDVNIYSKQGAWRPFSLDRYYNKVTKSQEIGNSFQITSSPFAMSDGIYYIQLDKNLDISDQNYFHGCFYNENDDSYGRVLYAYQNEAWVKPYGSISSSDNINFYKSKKFINKHKTNRIESNKINDSNNIIKKYIDIRDKSDIWDYNDYRRYVNSDNKIYIRFRTYNGKTFNRRSTSNIDVDYFQNAAFKDNVDTSNPTSSSNFYTYNDPFRYYDSYDRSFNWTKPNRLAENIDDDPSEDKFEKVYKLGLDYFRCQSK